jgi:hypothetical protein
LRTNCGLCPSTIFEAVFFNSQTPKKKVSHFIGRSTRIEKNTTILSNRSKILQKRNKHSDYHIMIKYLSNFNNFIVNGPCNEKNI